MPIQILTSETRTRQIAPRSRTPTTLSVRKETSNPALRRLSISPFLCAASNPLRRTPLPCSTPSSLLLRVPAGDNLRFVQEKHKSVQEFRICALEIVGFVFSKLIQQMARLCVRTGALASLCRAATPSLKQRGIIPVRLSESPRFYSDCVATAVKENEANKHRAGAAAIRPPSEKGRSPGRSPETSWWVPHPSTGVWVPEGQELHTLLNSSLAENQQPWFREDVHHGQTDHR